jgi:hypothetical protein
VSLFFPCVAISSSSVDICQEPLSETQLAIAYYKHENSSLQRTPGSTSRVEYRSDLLLKLDNRWTVGVGHRSTILNVDNLALQTNGYLHTFFLPVHRTKRVDGKSFRLSVSPVLSGSSNVVKDPSQYTVDALQLLAAMVWSKQMSDQLSLNYGVCGDHRFGGFQVYPVIGVDWQPYPDWRIELGFPVSRLKYQVTKSFELLLRAFPNGNEWYVKSKTLEKDSTLAYEAYVIESAFRWRLHQQIELTASVGRELDARYEMTLLDDSRVRLSSDPSTRVGVALAWYF